MSPDDPMWRRVWREKGARSLVSIASQTRLRRASAISSAHVGSLAKQGSPHNLTTLQLKTWLRMKPKAECCCKLSHSKDCSLGVRLRSRMRRWPENHFEARLGFSALASIRTESRLSASPCIRTLLRRESACGDYKARTDWVFIASSTAERVPAQSRSIVVRETLSSVTKLVIH